MVIGGSRISPPPPGSKINWEHPLSQKLVRAYLCAERSGKIVNDAAVGDLGVWNGVPRWPGHPMTGQTVPAGGLNFPAAGFVFTATDFIQTQYVFPTTNFTLSFWALCAHTDGSTARVRPCGAGDFTGGLNGVSVVWGFGNGLYVVLRQGVNNGTRDISATAPGGKSVAVGVHNIVVTVSSVEGAAVYMDGQLAGTNTGTLSITTGGLKFRIGGDANQNLGGWDGWTGNYLIWERPLRLLDIQKLYAEPYAVYQPVSLLRRFQLPTQQNAVTGASGIASGSAFGVPDVQRKLGPIGIASGAAAGSPTLNRVTATGITSGVAIGTPDVERLVTGQGIVSAAAVGRPTLNRVTSTGIVSAAAFGVPDVEREAEPVGIPSGAAIGHANVELTVSPGGITATAQVGSPTLTRTIAPAGIPSGAGFGTATVGRQVGPAGITSGAQVGTPRLIRVTLAGAIPSGEAFGQPTLTLTVRGSVAGDVHLSEVVRVRIRVSDRPSFAFDVHLSEGVGEMRLSDGLTFDARVDEWAADIQVCDWPAAGEDDEAVTGRGYGDGLYGDGTYGGD